MARAKMPEAPEGPPKKPKKKRRALRVAGWVLGTPLVLVGLGLGYLHTGSGKARVRSLIEARLTERVNGKVEVGAVDYALFGEVKAGDIHVKDDAGVEAAALSSLSVSPSWSDLVRGRIVIDRVSVAGVTLHVVKDADGGSNLQRLIKPRPEDPNKKPLDKQIVVKALSIGQVGVDVLQPDGTRVLLSDAAIEGALSVLPATKDVEVEIGKIALGVAIDKGEGGLKVGIKEIATGVTLKLSQGKGKATLHPLTGKVAVTLPGQPERGFDIGLNELSADIGEGGLGVSLDKLLAGALALASVEVKGNVQDGKICGEQQADVIGLKVSSQRVNELLGREVLRGDIEVETHIHGPPDKIDVGCKITTGGATAVLDGSIGIEDPANPTYDCSLSLSGVDTDKLLASGLGVSPIGVDKVEVSVKGKGRTPQSAGAVATVKVEGVTAQGVKIDGLNFVGELDKGILKVKSVEAKGLGQRVTASGEVELANKRIDLVVGLEGDAGDLLSRLRAAGVPVKSNLPRGAVRLAPGDFTITAKGLLGGGMDVTASAKKIGVLGGSLKLDARASVLRHDPPLDNGKKVTVTAMDADIHVAGVKLSSILALRGKKLDAVDGALSGDVHVEGTPESPRAKLTLGMLTSRADGGKPVRLSVTGDVTPRSADVRASLLPVNESGEIFGLRAKLPLTFSGAKKGIDPYRPIDVHAELAKSKLAALWAYVPKTQALSNIDTLPDGDLAVSLDVKGTAAKPDGKLDVTLTANALPGMTQKVAVTGTIKPGEKGLAAQAIVDAWYDQTKPRLAHIVGDVSLSSSPVIAKPEVGYHLRGDVGPLDLSEPTGMLKKANMIPEIVEGMVFASVDLQGNKEDLTGKVMASADGLRPKKSGRAGAALSLDLGEKGTDVNLKVRIADSPDGPAKSELLSLSGKVGLPGKGLFAALKDKEHLDPELALALDIPKRALSSLAVVLDPPKDSAPAGEPPRSLAKAPGDLAGSIAISGTAKMPLAKGSLAVSGVERMDGQQGGLGVALDAGKDQISALIGAGVPEVDKAPLKIAVKVPRDAVMRLADKKTAEGAVLPVEASIRGTGVDLKSLVPAVLLGDTKVGVKGALDWSMDVRASLTKTAKSMEITSGAVSGALDLRGGAVAIPGTKRAYHDIGIHLAADDKGLHLDALRAKETDLEQKDRSLTVKADVTLDKLRPTAAKLSLAANQWLLFGPRSLGFADAPRGTLSIDAQANADLSQPIKKATIDVKKLELIAPERFERAHQPEDVQAGDLVFLDEGKVALGKLPVPDSVKEKAEPRKAEVKPEPAKDGEKAKESGYDIDIKLADIHLLRAPIDISPSGQIHIKLREGSREVKGDLKIERGGLSLGGQVHPVVKGSVTFDEQNPKGYLDIYFERPLRPYALRNISQASAGTGLKVHLFGPLTDYKTVLSGAGSPGALWDVLSMNTAGRERRVTEPDLPGSMTVDFPQHDSLLVLSFLSVNVPHLLFLDKFAVWADPYDDPRAYGRLTHVEAERYVAGDSVRVRAGARPPAAGQSEAELEIDYLFVNVPRMLFGVGLTGGTRGGGGPGVVWEWSSKD